MNNANGKLRWRVAGAAATLLLGSAAQAQILSIDMDPLTAGIQNTLATTVGQNISVDILLQAGGTGISSYGVSVQFDNTELGHTGDAELLPAGFQFNFTPGSGGLVKNVAPGVDQVSTFEAATLANGPVNGPPFLIGTINFSVVGVANDGLADITPGFFVGGVDAMFDNNGAALAPVINPGYVIPEPATVSGVVLLLGFAGFRVCRRIWAAA